MSENFYSDPEAMEAMRDPNLPPELAENPLFDDEPTPLPGEEPRQVAPPPAPEPEPEEEPEPPQRAAQPNFAHQPSPVHLDPNALAQAIIAAQRAMQPPPQYREEDFDPPEVEVDEEAILEGRASLKKAIREAQKTTARSVRGQIFESLQPHLQALQGYGQYIQSRLPIDAWNARQAARSRLIQQGFADEGEIDGLLDSADPLLQNDWNHKVNPDSWIAAAQYASMNRNGGNLPVRQKPRKAPGAGRGDVAPQRAAEQHPVLKNPHLATIEKLNGKPLNRDRAKDFLEARHGRH